MQALLDQFRDSLSENAWTIVPRPPASRLPTVLDGADDALRAFVASTHSCESADGAVWFTGMDEFVREDGEGWDFLRAAISEPSAEGRPDDLAEVRRHWDQHLPFAIHTRGDYGYLALNRAGEVVCGFAPELEETCVVAPSYARFLQTVVDQCHDRDGDFFRLWIAAP